MKRRKAAPPGTGANKKARGGRYVNVSDFEAPARERLSRMVVEYVAAGAADEITLRRNRAAFDRILLKPRVLVDVSKIDLSVSLLGRSHAIPILLAPAAYQKLLHRKGERATLHGAEAAGVTLVVSSFATVSLEELARAAKSPLWFQLYVQQDRGFTQELILRAEAAGYEALVVTVDTPVLGLRDREARVNFRLPKGIERVNLKTFSARAAQAGHAPSEGGIYNLLLSPDLTWKGIDWIRSVTRLPVVLKGILSPEDARLASEHGAAGIIVSNHGARNLDTLPATIEALPRVVDAVAGRLDILLDGGIRRGTDVMKAIALGANSVLIGRPYLWALAAEGAAGVEQVIHMLRNELAAAMALCGMPSTSQVSRDVLWPVP
jgi:4-hydroxymandelate oxidase